ncbi:unnamed protein product [Arabidopsis halleri]
MSSYHLQTQDHLHYQIPLSQSATHCIHQFHPTQ